MVHALFIIFPDVLPMQKKQPSRNRHEGQVQSDSVVEHELGNIVDGPGSFQGGGLPSA